LGVSPGVVTLPDGAEGHRKGGEDAGRGVSRRLGSSLGKGARPLEIFNLLVGLLADAADGVGSRCLP
jgi:hypothetical protein